MKLKKVFKDKPSGDVYTEAVKLVLDNKVSMDKDRWFIVNDHSVRLFDEKIKTKQMIHKSMCDCTRASLINTKYGTVCVHIKAAELFLMLDIAKNMWGGDVLFADRLKYNRVNSRAAIGDYENHFLEACPSCGFIEEVEDGKESA